MNDNKCKICFSDISHMFNKDILKKYKTAYFQCKNCGFLQTEKPYWLDESYSNAITSLDIGLVNRNIKYADIIEDVLYNNFNIKSKFLDFAGGYGMFTRIMRDKGFDFYHEDKHCENIFAKYFTINDLRPEEKQFELVTAFELMEHIENPFKQLDYIFSMTDSFLFSTELIPSFGLENWWYLGEEHGQHISFYTKKSIKEIAKKYNKIYYTNGYMHLLTSKKGLDIFTKKESIRNLFKSFFERTSIIGKLSSKTQDDYEYIRNGGLLNKSKLEKKVDYNEINAYQALNFGGVKNKKVLVVGCNTGKDCTYFINAGAAEVCGLDVLDDIGIDYKHDKVSYYKESAENMVSLADNHFDLVYCFATLEHVPDISSAYKEMVRVAKKGGIIYTVAGPLWNSPYGHHKINLFDGYPWIHLSLDKDEIKKWFITNKSSSLPDYINNIDAHVDYMLNTDNFNKRSASEYIDICNNLGVDVLVNQTDSDPANKLTKEAKEKLVPIYGEKELLAVIHRFVGKKI